MRLNIMRTRGAMLSAVGAVVAVLMVAGVATVDAGDKDHGYLGVYMQDLTREVRKGLDLDVSDGTLVSGVEEDSPAEKAGLEEGDVIVKFNGQDVEDADNLSDLVGDLAPGTEVEIEVVRDGKKKTLKATLGERPEDGWFSWSSDGHDFDFSQLHDLGRGMGHRGMVAEFLPGPKLGVRAMQLNEDLAGYFDTNDGVLVLDVHEESVAEEAGVKSGDVIQKIEDQEISEVSDIHDALRDMEDDDKFVVTVLRKGKSQKLDATMKDSREVSFFRGNAPRVRVLRDRLRNHHAPRIHIDTDEMKDDIREELDELRKELKELKKELKKKG